MANIIVTGANGGIGYAIVEKYAKEGNNVWAIYRTRKDEVIQKFKILENKYHVWIKSVQCDFTSEDNVIETFRMIVTDKENIDVLINCAGIGHMALFEMTPRRKIEEIYKVNVFAPMIICQLVIRKMIRQKNGYIINITSTAGEESYIGNTIYGSSKAALATFSKSLAAEMARYNITVNAIAPGLTDTQMSKIFENGNAELPLQRSVLGRKINPTEIAEAIFLLTSTNIEIINGQELKLNGGAK